MCHTRSRCTCGLQSETAVRSIQQQTVIAAAVLITAVWKSEQSSWETIALFQVAQITHSSTCLVWWGSPPPRCPHTCLQKCANSWEQRLRIQQQKRANSEPWIITISNVLDDEKIWERCVTLHIFRGWKSVKQTMILVHRFSFFFSMLFTTERGGTIFDQKQKNHLFFFLLKLLVVKRTARTTSCSRNNTHRKALVQCAFSQCRHPHLHGGSVAPLSRRIQRLRSRPAPTNTALRFMYRNHVSQVFSHERISVWSDASPPAALHCCEWKRASMMAASTDVRSTQCSASLMPNLGLSVYGSTKCSCNYFFVLACECTVRCLVN